tara:strand:- start:760 stop:990 length:231 start_codon:yes stop_codon:yes gene_type:complete
LRGDSIAESQRPIHEGEDGQGIVSRPCGSPRLEEAEVVLYEDGLDPRGLEDGRDGEATVEERDPTKAMGMHELRRG